MKAGQNVSGAVKHFAKSDQNIVGKASRSQCLHFLWKLLFLLWLTGCLWAVTSAPKECGTIPAALRTHIRLLQQNDSSANGLSTVVNFNAHAEQGEGAHSTQPLASASPGITAALPELSFSPAAPLPVATAAQSEGLLSSMSPEYPAVLSNPQESISIPHLTCNAIDATTGTECRASNFSRRDMVDLTYPPFTVNYPNFIRTSHLVWWESFEVVKWRRKSNCPGRRHPIISHPTVNFYLEDPFGPSLLQAQSAVQNIGDRVDHVPEPGGYLHFCEPEYTEGQVTLLKEATVAAPDYQIHGCGPTDSAGTIERFAQMLPPSGDIPHVRNLFWAMIPAAPFFQHWLQNVMPKLAQAASAYPALLQPPSQDGDAWVANQELLPERFPIIFQFYEHMKWTPPVSVQNSHILVDNLLYSCKAPPLHPVLWKRGQSEVLQVKAANTTRTKIVYCGRTRVGVIENEGRRVMNEVYVLSLLTEWARNSVEGAPLYEVYEFDHTQFTSIQQLVEFWSDVRLIVGPHGGCLSNLVFMPPGGAVVELFPLIFGIKPPLRHSGMMMYMQSSFLNHEYWMLPTATDHVRGNFDVPVGELCEILVRILGNPWADSLCRPFPNPVDEYLNYVKLSVPTSAN